MAGIFGAKAKDPANNAKNTPVPTESPAMTARAEMAQIPGGTFTMGRNDGGDLERPEHQVTVPPFMMDKTEVSNAEYYEFVKETKYKEIPVHWVNGAPIKDQMEFPVRFVNVADVNAFAKWRSERDGFKYRLPTEQEWEFAARNGSDANLYPWGDKFDAKCAFVDRDNDEPQAVGKTECANKWGVKDLIGNVIEWTGSGVWLYPGSKGEIVFSGEPRFMVRGGSSRYKSTGPTAITSTFRLDSPQSTRHAALGFRLVRSE